MSLPTLVPGAWWRCRCNPSPKKLAPYNWWRCCHCNSHNNPAMSPERCGNCGHVKCEACKLSTAALCSGGEVTLNKDSPEQQHISTRVQGDKAHCFVPFESRREGSSGSCDCISIFNSIPPPEDSKLSESCFLNAIITSFQTYVPDVTFEDQTGGQRYGKSPADPEAMERGHQ